MTVNKGKGDVTVGVLALQGAFSEHIQLLRQAAEILADKHTTLVRRRWTFIEVRTELELSSCDALIIPGGESTAISLVAQRSNMLEPLRDFVKVSRKPTWGTCAGLILLAESANRTKKGGQELIGGLDVRVNRNHFGRQIESFQANLDLPFLSKANGNDFVGTNEPFKAIFIRAPIVERLLPNVNGEQIEQATIEETVIAPSRSMDETVRKIINIGEVEVMGILPGRAAALKHDGTKEKLDAEAGDIIAVRQANVFGTSFHPELTGDARIHVWWLEQVSEALNRRRSP
ncbi:Pyridoxal 5 -phosphate synthase glutaminase subunit [Hyphodiscus hymeniophilus]|uniref:glutaminase n=1 Tax=Hyphodiscus hymeniophilus TaxID=353542 RepID=A0A9P6VGI3_9HELO|nr:Pyridoxal 5 -phosphate synthase glutaminase subunit [Hyphodiscus hymeniophilus]